MDRKKDRHRMVICNICLKVKRSNNLKRHMRVHAKKDTFKVKSISANMHLNAKKGDTSFEIKSDQISSFKIKNEQMSNETIEDELIGDEKIYDEGDIDFVQYAPSMTPLFEGQHQSSSTAPSRYACPICPKSFSRMRNLLKHEEKQHSNLIGKIITRILSEKKIVSPILPDHNFLAYLTLCILYSCFTFFF